MPLITLLRKVASHVDLIKANPADRHANPGKFAWDCQLAQRLLGPDLDAVGGAVQETAHMRQVDTALCGKLTALKALLAEWAADGKGAGGRPHKVLIFSNSVRMLRIIERVAINAG